MGLINIEFDKNIIKNAAPKCGEVILLESVDSTNSFARNKCLDKIADKTVIIACKQTAGRGRRGKSFYSPGGGLYMSLVLNADGIKAASAQLMTVCAGVAVCRGLKSVCKIDVGIKWVNDIFCDGLKICGILCEAVTDSATLAVTHYIVGIGINIGNTEFPEQIKNVAGSVVCPKGAQSLLAATIAEELFEIIESAQMRDIVSEYRSLSILINRPVNFTLNGKYYSGIAKDISENGGLIVDCGGEFLTLSSGEVSLGSANYTAEQN